MGGPMRGVVRLLAVMVFVAMGVNAQAQVCGDPDGSGSVTVTDGVAMLRAAAGLSSVCDVTVCDVNGDGEITVTDAVNSLRNAAGLTAAINCGTGVSHFVSDVQIKGGDHAVLEVGAAPIPAANAPDTIGTPNGSGDAVAGASNDVTVPFDSTSQASAATIGNGLTFVLAVADLNGNLTDGIYEIPLDKASGQVEVEVTFPKSLGSSSFLLCPATRNNGVLSQYGILRQDPSSGQVHPTPTRTGIIGGAFGEVARFSVSLPR